MGGEKTGRARIEATLPEEREREREREA